MQLGLGPATIPLQDGMSSWDASAADALDIWNGYLDFISISSVSSPTVPEVSGDGINSVFFSNTIFGDSFGDGGLAVTVLLSTGSDASATAEADVVVNSAFRYDSYRGPEQSDIYDFHRIVLHEFGHVLGLDHVTNNPPGQAIMEPIISDLDHLGADDVGGIRQLYGAEITNLYGQLSARVGDSFTYFALEANNSPTSYSAIGLPPGVTINSTTGSMSGKETTAGDYNPVITAHGPFAEAYASFQITVRDLDEVQGLLEIVSVDATSVVADPIRPRIYTAGDTGINMIDTETYKVTELVAGYQRAKHLSISADFSALLYAEPSRSVADKIDLESLEALPGVPIPTSYSAVLEGLDNRAYVGGLAGVYQFDATTGAMQEVFEPSFAPQVAISADRKTLFVTQAGASLSTYDISTPDPLLVHKITGSFSYPSPSSDGQYLYYVEQPPGQSQQSFQASLPALSPSSSFATGNSLASISVGPDGSIYQCTLENYRAGSIFVYDPVSLQLTSTVDLSHLDPFTAYQPFSIVFDNSGKYFFASVAAYGSSEVWVFSTDLASFPAPPANPTKNLLNISTRARVETGEDAMIGGFIVQGPDPKRVLIRGLGPSLPLTGALSDPVLDLYDSSGKLLASNDNWISDRLNIIGSQLAPTSEREAAVLMALEPGAYTAVVRDSSNQPGLALVEVYDLDPSSSLLANISTRGKVETADNVMIGGFIIGGVDATQVLVRAIGPSLATQGIQQPLADPVLELHDGNGTLISTNDNWRSTQQTDIVATGVQPTDDRESAILTTLQPGSYTAIVRGQNSTTGVALVEVYNLDGASTASK